MTISKTSSAKRAPLLIGAVIVVCLAGLVWFLRPAEKGGDATSNPIVPKVLCSSCGFIADASKVELQGEAARVPGMGPGYKCPQCGQRTLYPNPYICKQCNTPFLMGRDAAGEFTSKCPKCGTVN